MALSDQAGKPHRATVDQRDAEPPAVDAEHSVCGRHSQVAPKGELEPTGNGVALDRGDHGLCSSSQVGPIGPGPLSRTGRRSPSAIAFRSAPAQKVPPEPVSTATMSRVVDLECLEGSAAGQWRSRNRPRCASRVGDGDDRHGPIVTSTTIVSVVRALSGCRAPPAAFWQGGLGRINLTHPVDNRADLPID